MKKIETIFSQKSKSDSKSILNKLNKKIDQSILDKIEAGITLENIEELTKSGIPVLKYHTQITVHGLFPELQNNYIFGYKNVFQNKNRSIGVKYNAIDEEKRQRIAKRLKCIGLSYNRSSQETKYTKMNRVDAENFEAIKRYYLELNNKIDSNLYFGNSLIWIGKAFGITYIVFELSINAIYERNIEEFLNKLGATSELLRQKEESDKKEAEELEKQYKKEAEERQKVKEAILKTMDSQIQELNKFPRIEKTSEPGMYILKQFNYKDELIFKVIYIYTIKGKQKPRYNKTEYNSVFDALKHNCTENWSDSIYSGRLTGRKIK